jgi:hypothetical protein
MIFFGQCNFTFLPQDFHLISYHLNKYKIYLNNLNSYESLLGTRLMPKTQI